mgnify:CR=1 FL=1
MTMATKTDLTQLKHMMVPSTLHFYYEPQPEIGRAHV